MMTKNNNIKTEKVKIKTVKINPGEFAPIIATFKGGITIVYTMDIIDLLKTDPGVIQIETPDGNILYKKEV